MKKKSLSLCLVASLIATQLISGASIFADVEVQGVDDIIYPLVDVTEQSDIIIPDDTLVQLSYVYDEEVLDEDINVYIPSEYYADYELSPEILVDKVNIDLVDYYAVGDIIIESFDEYDSMCHTTITEDEDLYYVDIVIDTKLITQGIDGTYTYLIQIGDANYTNNITLSGDIDSKYEGYSAYLSSDYVGTEDIPLTVYSQSKNEIDPEDVIVSVVEHSIQDTYTVYATEDIFTDDSNFNAGIADIEIDYSTLDYDDNSQLYSCLVYTYYELDLSADNEDITNGDLLTYISYLTYSDPAYASPIYLSAGDYVMTYLDYLVDIYYISDEGTVTVYLDSSYVVDTASIVIEDSEGTEYYLSSVATVGDVQEDYTPYTTIEIEDVDLVVGDSITLSCTYDTIQGVEYTDSFELNVESSDDSNSDTQDVKLNNSEISSGMFIAEEDYYKIVLECENLDTSSVAIYLQDSDGEVYPFTIESLVVGADSLYTYTLIQDFGADVTGDIIIKASNLNGIEYIFTIEAVTLDTTAPVAGLINRVSEFNEDTYKEDVYDWGYSVSDLNLDLENSYVTVINANNEEVNVPVDFEAQGDGLYYIYPFHAVEITEKCIYSMEVYFVDYAGNEYGDPSVFTLSATDGIEEFEVVVQGLSNNSTYSGFGDITVLLNNTEGLDKVSSIYAFVISEDGTEMYELEVTGASGVYTLSGESLEDGNYQLVVYTYVDATMETTRYINFTIDSTSENGNIGDTDIIAESDDTPIEYTESEDTEDTITIPEEYSVDYLYGIAKDAIVNSFDAVVAGVNTPYVLKSSEVYAYVINEDGVKYELTIYDILGDDYIELEDGNYWQEFGLMLPDGVKFEDGNYQLVVSGVSSSADDDEEESIYMVVNFSIDSEAEFSTSELDEYFYGDNEELWTIKGVYDTESGEVIPLTGDGFNSKLLIFICCMSLFSAVAVVFEHRQKLV